MKTRNWNEILRGFGFKRWLLLGLNLVLLIACAACAVGVRQISTTLNTTTAAERFRGESDTRFAQLACYLPAGQGVTQEEIFTFRQTLESKFTEQSLEAPENGSLTIDAYCASEKVTATTDYGSAELTALGVGGDFFYFHPLSLRSGSYISERDLMDDLVVLDESLAWRLFGSTDLAGMTMWINGEPFVVSGVVTLEEDFATAKARTQEGALFLSYSALNRLKEELTIDCYEIVLPDPITGYASGVMEENFPIGTGDLVENSSRYSLGHLLKIAGSVGERSMRTNGVIYPYWENALRLTEDYAALLLILAILFALCPLVFAGVLAIRAICRGYRRIKKAVPEKIDSAVERRREHKYESKTGGE